MARATVPFALWTMLLGGCVPAAAGGAPLYGGRAEGSPGLDALPDPGASVPDPAWRRAAASFGVPAPPIPADADMATLGSFIDGELVPWLQRKDARIQAARSELDRAADTSYRQRIIAGAILGLLYEDVARVLLSLPEPIDLVDDPEIARIYTDTVALRARPYVAQARQAYRACERNADQAPRMRRFARFCAAREEQLPIDERIISRSAQTLVTFSISD